MTEEKGMGNRRSPHLSAGIAPLPPQSNPGAPRDPKGHDSTPSPPTEDETTHLRFFEKLAVVAILATVYFVAGKLALKLAFVHPSASPVWPPTGIALAALLLLGYRVWPAILVGAFFVNLTTAGSAATSVGIAIGNTLEGLTGAYLVNRLAGGRQVFDRARDIFKFATLAGMLSTMVSATFGVTSLCLGGFAAWPHFGSIWLTWWLGDAVGDLVVAPLLVLWSTRPRVRWNRDQFFEAATLLLSLFLVSEVVFSGLSGFGIRNYPLEVVCIPFLIWPAFRFTQREVAIAVSVMSVIAIRGTLHGFGPFAKGTPNESLLLVEAFVGITGVMTIAIAASVSERRRLDTERKRAEERFRLVVESAPNAMVMAGGQGKIVLVNSQAEKLFGYGREELIGQPIEMLVPQRFRSEHPAYRARFAAQPRARPMGAGRDLYAVRKDGSEFPVEIGLNPIETEEGTLVLSAIVDITERKRAELAMQEANEKLKAWVSELEQRTRETALLNQTSHLLQTCLTTEEAYTVIGQFAGKLFPADSGAVCALNASLNLVETVCVWGESPPNEHVFSPQECWALRSGQVHAVQDARSALLCQHLRHQPPANSLCVPMMAQGEALGVLHLRGRQEQASPLGEEGARLRASREQLAVTVAGHIALALANLRLRETLRIQSIRDPLTGLYNRRYLKESLEREVRRVARSQRPLAVIMLDVDHFKEFNDTFGHDAADALLRELGNFLQKRTRGEDIACRYGGDEFVLILAEASVGAAERRAEQLREGIKHLTVPHGEQYLRPPTVSLGVALYPEHGLTAEALLRAADEALYCAKAEGRDRVVVGQANDIA